MERAIKLIAAIACGLFAFPAPSLASCSSSLVPTADVAGSNSRLLAIGGSSPTDLWAVGGSCPSDNPCASQTLIEHLTGSTWSIVSSPNYPQSTYDRLIGVTAESPTNAWAVGSWSSGRGNAVHALFEHWDGNAWTVLHNGGWEALNGVSSVPGDPTSVWAVGIHSPPTCRSPFGCSYPVAEHWHVGHSRWEHTKVPSGSLGLGSLSDVISLPSGSAWAVGQAENRYNGSAPLVVRWTGSSWETVTNPVTKGFLTSVSALSDTDVWVTGDNPPNGPVLRRFVEHWNGSQWTVYDFPSLHDAFLFSIAERTPTDVWTVSNYLPSSSTNAGLPSLAHFDGASWSVIPTPSDGLGSGPVALYPTPGGILAVGSSLPAIDYKVITYASLSNC